MAAILLSAPALEPVSVAEAKAYLRVDHDDDDAVIAALIAAARGHVEALTRRGLIAQTWRFVRDSWPPDGRMRLRSGPLRSLIAARVFDAGGTASSIDIASFVLDKANDTIAAPAWALPPPGRAIAGIELDVQLGYGMAAGDVPDALRHAIRMLTAHWYDNRGQVAIGQAVPVLPPSVNAIIGSFRVLSL